MSLRCSTGMCTYTFCMHAICMQIQHGTCFPHFGGFKVFYLVCDTKTTMSGGGDDTATPKDTSHSSYTACLLYSFSRKDKTQPDASKGCALLLFHNGMQQSEMHDRDYIESSLNSELHTRVTCLGPSPFVKG